MPPSPRRGEAGLRTSRLAPGAVAEPQSSSDPGQGTRAGAPGGARARAAETQRTTSPPGESGAGRAEGPHAPRAPAPTFLDSRQLGLIDADFSHVGPGSRQPLAARGPAAAAAGPERGPARSSSSARRGAKSRRQRAPTRGRSGRRGRAGDKGGGRPVPASQAGVPAAPPQPPAPAPPAQPDTEAPEPGNGPGRSSTEGERRQKGGRAGGRTGLVGEGRGGAGL